RLGPHVTQVNLRALQARAPQRPALDRMDRIAQVVTGRDEATASEGVAWLTELSQALHIPALGSYGLASADIPLIVERAMAASSTRANPIALEARELAEAIEAAL
ncbi:MAG: iron-containing alcohol dehydrogenase, partial [Chloroflexi bacterium]|nr:iron-containing alcohol dehydrogenase [Chloroflexota bacterium]